MPMRSGTETFDGSGFVEGLSAGGVSGVAGCSGAAAPEETVIVTVLPAAATTPAAGDWLMTSPAGTLELVACLAVALNPAPSSVDSASLCARPTTFGTADSVGAGRP